MSDVRRTTWLAAHCSTKWQDQQGGAAITIHLGSSMGAGGALQMSEIHTTNTHVSNQREV